MGCISNCLRGDGDFPPFSKARFIVRCFCGAGGVLPLACYTVVHAIRAVEDTITGGLLPMVPADGTQAGCVNPGERKRGTF